MSIFAPLCVHIHSKAKGGQSLNTGHNMDKYRKFGQTPHIEEVTSPRPIWTTWTTESRHGAGGVHIRPVVCVVFTTGQKPETDERHAFSFGRVLAVFVKCRNTTENTEICPLFRLFLADL